MKKINFLLSSLLVILLCTQHSIALNQKDSPYLTKEFTLEGKGNLEVRTSGGSIGVTGNNSNKVLVEMHVRRNGKSVDPDDAEVRKLLEEYKIDISKSGNKVSAISERKGSNWGNNRNNLSVSFKVTVPESISCSLNTSGGSIDIQKLKGEQDANTSGGSINIQEITGNTKARTSGGSINISQYQGKLDANTSGGSINMSKSRGDLSVNTSGGSIKLDDVSGSISANTSGGGINAKILELENNLTLTTSGGSIHAVVPKGLGMDLDLRGNHVNTKLTNFTGEAKKDKIVGSINGGGAKVKLTTSGGSVSLDYD
ncbi:MAG: DUF4097 domain-containing protein [Bacteroidota bacterium]|nr:DUF4097 domain-containing protein [Bacteroidota bacterium]